MKLLIISHTEHYRDDSGTIVGWGPTVREIDALAQVFDTVTHIAPLHNTPAPRSAIPYQAANVVFRPVRPAGGERVADKLAILVRIPPYMWTILRDLPNVDVVHVRCPANISLIAIVLLMLVRHPRVRWIKYAGNWHPTHHEPHTYRFQRWWLRRNLHRGVVTVNGHWPDQPAHIRSFLNPCLTDEEWAEAQRLGDARQITQPIHLLYVGQLNKAKGVGRTLEILAEVRRRNIAATLDLVGDGDARPLFEAQARQLGVVQDTSFRGWLPRLELGRFYAGSHLLLLPTDSSEGWPKVLSEAMAYGVVPLSGNVSSIPQYLKTFDTGHVLDPYDVAGFAEAILWYTRRPDDWRRESQNGMTAAALFTYTHYVNAVCELLGIRRP